MYIYVYIYIYKIAQIKMRGRVERLSNNRMPKQIVTGRMEGTGKRVEPWRRWTVEAQEDLKTT